MTDTTDPQTARAHRAEFTVTATSRPDGGHYFDQADFAAHVAQWIKTDLRDHHAIAEVTATDAPPATDRAASYRLAADAIERMQGYPHLILPEEIVAALRLLATGAQPEPGSPAYTRRLAAGERDEQQAQQDGPETRPARGDEFEAWLKAQRDRYDRTDQREESSEFWHEFDAALDLYRLHADTGTPLGGHVCEARVVGQCECLEAPTAAPVAGQPPADTGEEAQS